MSSSPYRKAEDRREEDGRIIVLFIGVCLVSLVLAVMFVAAANSISGAVAVALSFPECSQTTETTAPAQDGPATTLEITIEKEAPLARLRGRMLAWWALRHYDHVVLFYT